MDECQVTSTLQYATCGLTDDEALTIAMHDSLITKQEDEKLRTAICISSDSDNEGITDPPKIWRSVEDCPGLSRGVLVQTVDGDMMEVDDEYPSALNPSIERKSVECKAPINPHMTVQKTQVPQIVQNACISYIPPKNHDDEKEQLALALAMSETETRYHNYRQQEYQNYSQITKTILNIAGMKLVIVTDYVDGSAVINANMISAKDPIEELKVGNFNNCEGPYCFLIAIWHKNKSFFENLEPAIRSPYAILAHLKLVGLPPKPDTMYDKDSIESFAKYFNVTVNIKVVRIDDTLYHMDQVNNVPNTTAILTVTLNIDKTHYITGLEC